MTAEQPRVVVPIVLPSKNPQLTVCRPQFFGGVDFLLIWRFPGLVDVVAA
jgi:hypothetical protein